MKWGQNLGLDTLTPWSPLPPPYPSQGVITKTLD